MFGKIIALATCLFGLANAGALYNNGLAGLNTLNYGTTALGYGNNALGYGGYARGYGGYGPATSYTTVNRVVPGHNNWGYSTTNGHGLGYAGALGGINTGLGYSGLGYSGLGYSGLGYSGLGIANGAYRGYGYGGWGNGAWGTGAWGNGAWGNGAWGKGYNTLAY